MAGKCASPTLPVSTTERLLSFAEAAARLNLGVSTLRQKIHAGCGPVAIRLPGPGPTHWRFRPRDLDDYVRAAEVRPEKLASTTSAAEELTN
jgi:excisionase family DNA binding protein